MVHGRRNRFKAYYGLRWLWFALGLLWWAGTRVTAQFRGELPASLRPVRGGRGLLKDDVAVATGWRGFPYMKCDTYACTCSPYSLTYTGEMKTPKGDRHCFTVGYVGCSPDEPSCCGSFQMLVRGFHLSISVSCLAPAIKGVELGGINWTGWMTSRGTLRGVSGYTLQVYGLNHNATTFPGTTICVFVGESCSTFKKLCDTSNGGCRFSLTGVAQPGGNLKPCPACQVATARPTSPPAPKASPLTPHPTLPLPSSKIKTCTLMAVTVARTIAPSLPPVRLATCSGLAGLIAKTWRDVARAEGVALQAPFALEDCRRALEVTLPAVMEVSVCGALSSLGDATKFEKQYDRMVAVWISYTFGSPILDPGIVLCPPASYKIAGYVYGDVDGFPDYYRAVECSGNRLAPTPPEGPTRSSPSHRLLPSSPILPRPRLLPVSISACTSVAVTAPPAGRAPEGTAMLATCDGLAALIANTWRDIATAEGVALSTPFALAGCKTGDELEHPALLELISCGAFSSLADAEKLEQNYDPMTAVWASYTFGSPISGSGIFPCPPAVYRVSCRIYGDVDGFPEYYRSVACSDERLTPIPRPMHRL